MFDLILGAGFIVKSVLALLGVASVASWAVILHKTRELNAAEADSDRFLKAYMDRPLNAVHEVAQRNSRSPLAVVFQAGFKELAQLERFRDGSREARAGQLGSVLQRLTWVQTEEAHRLERGLPFLATIGSSAPFVGLFGTVIGIMNAFQDIGATGSASLAVVAPGIAEALVATAVGLFAAIPAVIAYNYSNARLVHLLERLEAFRSEFDERLRRWEAKAA